MRIGDGVPYFTRNYYCLQMADGRWQMVGDYEIHNNDRISILIAESD
jgi:hypothetical protein